MATPKAVQRQLEQAEALIAQQSAPQPADPTIEVVTDAAQLVQPQAPAPAAPAPTPAPAPAPTAPRPDDSVDWKQRFLTTQGILQAQLPAAQARAAAAESKVSELSAEVAQLRQLITASKPPTDPPKPTVDPRDVEAFGEPMMDMVRRYVTGAIEALQGQMGSVLSDIDRRVAALEGNVRGVAQRTEESLDAQFWAALGQMVPDYETVNATAEWQDWLKVVDTFTGVQRQKLLDAAANAKDAARVAKFFEAFKASLPPSPSSALESMVSPSSGGAAPPPAAQAPTRIVTQKFIQDFYRDVTRGAYRGREADQAQIEQAINQAIAEGRVR